MGLINDVLTTPYKVLNIEEAVRPAGPRDILLSGKRIARRLNMVNIRHITMNTTSWFNSLQQT